MTQPTDLKTMIDKAISGNETIVRVDARVGGLETKVTQLDVRVGGLETKVTRLDVRVGSLETKVTRLDVRVGSLETKVADLVERADRTEVTLRKLEAATVRNTEGLHRLGVLFEDRDKKIDFMLEILLDLRQRSDDVAGLRDQVQSHDARIAALELSAKKPTERMPSR